MANPRDFRNRSTLEISGLVLLWYLSSAFSNITNKQILNFCGLPWSLTFVQLFFILLFCHVVFFLGLERKTHSLTFSNLLRLLPLSVSQIFTAYFTNLSLQLLDIFLVTTVKSLTPLSTSFFSFFMLGERASRRVLLCIFIIVCGVVITSTADHDISGGLRFSALGMFSALASTCLNSYSNVYSKKEFQGAEDGHFVGPTTLLSMITLLSMLPAAAMAALGETAQVREVLADVGRIDGSVMCAGEVPYLYFFDAPTPLYVLSLFAVNGLCHFLHLYCAFQVHYRLMVLSYSIVNLLKKFFVIFFALLVFQEVITPQAAIGMAVAFSASFAYSQIRERERRHHDLPA